MIYKNIEIHSIEEVIPCKDGGVTWLKIPPKVYDNLERADTGKPVAHNSNGVELRFVIEGKDAKIIMQSLDGEHSVPSYWADIPGQFKVFIDRCTPWCNTHEPHATISSGKKGYSIALRTGPSMKECNRIIESIEHFYGHLEIEACGNLGLCSIENKMDVTGRIDEIKEFCCVILQG